MAERLKRDNRLILAVLFLSALFILLPHIPPIEQTTNRDSGVFLYVGQAMTRGETPYVDVWDHKGIVLYWINAIASLLTPNSLWAIWAINLIFLMLSLAISFNLLGTLFGRAAAVIIGFAWLPRIDFINLAELYALPLQFLALVCFYRSQQRERDRTFVFAIGIIGAVIGFLRPNLIAIFVGIALYWLWTMFSTAKSRALERLIAFGLGALLTTGLFIGYSLATGSLTAMLDATFHYNSLYTAAASMNSRLTSALTGLQYLLIGGLAGIGLAGWIVSVAASLRNRNQSMRVPAVVVVAVIALPLEIAFSSMSGENFVHYYIAWLPALCVLGGYFIKLILDRLQTTPDLEQFVPSSLLVGALIVGLSAAPFASRVFNIYTSYQSPSRLADVLSLIDSKTGTGDTLLVWGSEPVVNYLSGVPAPSRYVYQYPLFLRGYESPAHFETFLSDLERNPPKLVIDTTSTNPAIPPLDAESRASWHPDSLKYRLTPSADPVFAYFAENYTYLTQTRPGWTVYIRKAQQTPP